MPQNDRYNLLAALRPDMDAQLDASLADLPPIVAESLAQYARYGRPVGGFLTAVLEGRLFDAACNADDLNRKALGNIARSIVWYFPNAAFGSEAKVERWMEAAVKRDPALLRF